MKTVYFTLTCVSFSLTGSEFVVNAVPFSCCNISAKTPCAHFPLPTFQEPTIYPAGCAAAVVTSFRLMLCWYFGIGSIVAFFVTVTDANTLLSIFVVVPPSSYVCLVCLFLSVLVMSECLIAWLSPHLVCSHYSYHC